MKKFLIVFLLIFICVVASSQPAQSPLLSIMKEELGRNMKTLSFEDYEKPYYISYHFVDRQEVSVSGSLGALLDENENTRRFIHVDVRVGN